MQEQNGGKPPDASRRATLGAIVVTAILLALGVWVFNRLDASQKAQNCIESGGRKCALIEPGTAR